MTQTEGHDPSRPERAPEPTDTGLCCPRCDYNLTGLTLDRCPECGLEGAIELGRRNGATHRRRRALIIIFAPLAAFVVVVCGEIVSVILFGGISGRRIPSHLRAFLYVELLLVLLAFADGLLLCRQLRHFDFYRRANVWVQGILAFVASVAYLAVVFVFFMGVILIHAV